MDTSVLSDQHYALDVAHRLVHAGVPVFTAKPALDDSGQWDPTGGHNGCGFWLPRGWQSSAPNPAIVDGWQPGEALCATGAGPLSYLDTDPRNGGQAARQSLRGAGLWPTVLGVAATPSGGEHELVNGLGVASRDGLCPGLDVKAGTAGNGVGFIFIPPTVRRSKTTGEVVAHRWTTPPNLDELDPHDDSGAALAQMIREAHGSTTERVDVPHDAFDVMDTETQERVRGYLTRIVEREREAFKTYATWSDGERDGRGRGWQKLIADLALRLGSLARADWTPWTMAQARVAFQQIVPTDMAQAFRAGGYHTMAEFRTHAVRKDPAVWPAALGPPHTDTDTDVDDDAAHPAPPRRTLAEVYEAFTRWLGTDYDLGVLDAVLCTAAAEKLPGDPAWLLVVSGSGAAKTETVGSLSGAGATITSTISSEGALLSGTSKRERARDATGGLLRKIGSSGLLVVKDVTSILSMHRDTRGAVLAALREVYDGYWERNLGSDGGRTLTWQGRLGVIGAVTTAWDAAHTVVAAMGDRFVLVRLDSAVGRQRSGRQAIANAGGEEAMRSELANAVGGMLSAVDTDTDLSLAEAEVDRLLGLADIVTLARTAVERDYRGDVVDSHAPEMPTRFAKQLTMIIRGGLALGMDREHAVAIACRCARDSAPPLRLAILLDVLDNPDSTTHAVRRRLEKPRATVDRELQALHMLGLLRVDEIVDAIRGRTTWHYRIADRIDTDALASMGSARNVSTPPHTHREQGMDKGCLPFDKSGTTPDEDQTHP